MNQKIPKALFIGNGINRAAPGALSWGNLLENLSLKFEIEIDLQNDLKPFPLAFEEMLISKSGTNFEGKLKNLKQHIGALFSAVENEQRDLSLHKKVMECGINEIITTNYDYNLEYAVRPDFDTQKKEFALNKQESKHSLYRGYSMDGVNVRHIHGELHHNRKISNAAHYTEESIMIGFEHYADYFLKIQDSIYGSKEKRRYVNREGVLGRISEQQPAKCWTDLFFTHDVLFIGFTLDFSENHLWWLLMQREEIAKKFNTKEWAIQNQVIFYYPEIPFVPFDYTCIDEASFNVLHRKKLVQQKNKAVTDILKALKVTIKPIPCSTYLEFYDKVLVEITV